MNRRAIRKYRAILGAIMFAAAILFTWAGHAIYFSPLVQEEHYHSPEIYRDTPDISGDIIGLDDIIFTPPSEIHDSFFSLNEIRPRLQPLSADYINRLLNFDYLISRIFLVDPETILFPSDIDIPNFIESDLSIDMSVSGPKVLIFHTHSAEMFVDSNPAYPMTGIMGVGKYLTQILNEIHGIETMHYTGRFDVIDGRTQRGGSYERMEPVIRQILQDNPSIQVVIDLHRDGVGEHVPPFVTYIDGTRTAQIMFFNGLSRRFRGGMAEDVHWLPNPYQSENLNFSFRLQLAANQLYPGIARRVYLRAFRYSLHMMPLSTLVEVGNQHNTQKDALNAMHPLADIIAAVVVPSP